MRLAAIDIGTNSVHMIVVRVRPDLSFEVIDREKAMVRLGAGGLDGKELTTEAMGAALQSAVDQGGSVVTGGERLLEDAAPDAYYVRPAIVRIEEQTEIVRTETFAPVVYVLPYDTLEEAIAINNAAAHGLSSSIFTQDQAEAEVFLGPEGSDCGIVNVNIGTSGAEIGGAFGGEKDTGGGRESGSDAWRAYMRRATNTVNYSGDLPLAQGVDFSV